MTGGDHDTPGAIPNADATKVTVRRVNATIATIWRSFRNGTTGRAGTAGIDAVEQISESSVACPPSRHRGQSNLIAAFVLKANGAWRQELQMVSAKPIEARMNGNRDWSD